MDRVSQIREKTDLIALVSEFIPLKKMGRNFKSNCPFHNEKTPSFVVSPDRQIWHCFGCGKGGDCFTFLMEYEHIEFVEALKTLGKKVGVDVELSDLDRGIVSQKERIYDLNKKTAEFYHYILTKHNAGKTALAYIKEKRGINDKVIETFKLGFAPSTSASLSSYLIQKKGAKKQDLIDAGLSFLREGRIHDFFFNRVIFPLLDHRGNYIGFSGRIIDNSITSSKYVNTRETLVYHKGEVFFGLNNAREDIKKEGSVIIMEGEFDVISSFQEGVGNAVAVKGTALTENQINLISRFAQKIILSFDEDSAGFEALKRSLSIFEKKGISIYVLKLTDGKDPDEAIKNNSLLFKKAVQHPQGVYDYLLDKTANLFNSRSIEGKKKLSEELLPIFSGIENEIIKEHYLKKLAEMLDSSLESIYRQVEKLKKREETTTQVKKQKDTVSRREALEQYVIALIVQAEDPKDYFEGIKKILLNINFVTPSYGKIVEIMKDFFDNNSWNSEGFLKVLPKELVEAFDACYLFPLPKFQKEEEYKSELLKSVLALNEISIKAKIKEILDKIKSQEKMDDSPKETISKLQEELSHYVSLLGASEQG